MYNDPTNWANKPSTISPINAANLNKLEQGLVDASIIADDAYNSSAYLFDGKVNTDKTYTEVSGSNNQGYLWNRATKSPDSLSNYAYNVYNINLSEGTPIAVTGYQATNNIYYAIAVFYDANMDPISAYAKGSSGGVKQKIIFVPANAAYVYINGQKTGNYAPKLETISFLPDTVIPDISNLKSQEIYLEDSKVDKEKNYTEISGTNYPAYLWRTDNNSQVSNNSYSYTVYSSGFSIGEPVAVSGFQTSNHNYHPVVAFYDSNMVLIEQYFSPASSGYVSRKIMLVPRNTAYIYINGQKTGSKIPRLESITYSNDDIVTDIKNLQFQEVYLNDSKQERQKSYTEIAGGTTSVGLWATDSGTPFPSYTDYAYTEYSSGFSDGDYIAIDGYQPSSYSTYKLCGFYDSLMNKIGEVYFERNGGFNKIFAFVPIGTAYIYVNGKPSSNPAKIYNITYTDFNFDGMIATQNMFNFELKNWMERNYRNGEYLTFSKRTPDHAVITFSIDDSRSDVSDVSDLFITKEVPLCLATVPSRLNAVCDNGDTVLQTCQKTVANGGEILCHSMSVIDHDSTAEDYFTYFVTNKKTLEDAGFKVRGIVKAGGGSDDPDIETVKTYLRSFYDYGTGFQYINDGRYNTARYSMESSLATLKSAVDAVASGGVVHFYGHGSTDLGNDWISKISDLIDYIGTVANAEIVTIGEALLENLRASFNE